MTYNTILPSFNIRHSTASTLTNRNSLWTARALTNLLELPALCTISEIFIVITFYPHKFNLEKAEHLFWFENSPHATYPINLVTSMTSLFFTHKKRFMCLSRNPKKDSFICKRLLWSFILFLFYNWDLVLWRQNQWREGRRKRG